MEVMVEELERSYGNDLLIWKEYCDMEIFRNVMILMHLIEAKLQIKHYLYLNITQCNTNHSNIPLSQIEMSLGLNKVE